MRWDPVGRRRIGLLAGWVLVLLPLVAAACTPGQNTYPGDNWSRVDPADAGFDPAVLDDIAAEAEANASHCLVVIRHGELVADWYWNGADATTSREIFSATKSVTSTLIGIAQAEGALDIHDRAAEYIPQWADTAAADITIEDLLSNDSGRHWDLVSDYVNLVQATDRTAFGIGLGQDVPPGQTWVYNNAAIQTLDAVLEAATGEDPADFAASRLFGPLGMTHTSMTRDGAGNTNMFFGVHSTCEDMARFGYLFLRNGRWAEDQIVPQAWVDAATDQPSQDINAAYGYLWWLNRLGPVTDPLHPLTREQAATAPHVQLVPNAPADMYWARGLGGQVVQVDPGSDTVVVRLGPGDRSATYGQANTAQVVTEALIDP
jgi:CubicO group peptidase (beta-lactamase class C family)